MDANLTFEQHFIKNFKKLSRVAFHCTGLFVSNSCKKKLFHKGVFLNIKILNQYERKNVLILP